MSQYHGDIRLGDTIDIKFHSQVSGAPTTLTTGTVVAYPGNSTTEITAGITLTADFDSRTGLNNVRIVATSGNGYLTATNYTLVMSAGTVGGNSVVGYCVGSFSIECRSALMPTAAARTLDVSTTGEGGVDWGNVGSPTTSLALTGTTIATSQVVASVTGSVGSVAGAVASVTGNVGGSVASVTAGVTVTTNNDKTGYALSAAGLGAISTWTVALTGNITGNLSGSVGSVTAGVTVTTNSDKTGYALVSTGLAAVTAWTVGITGNVTGNLSGSVGSVSGNVAGSVGGNVLGSVGSVVATVDANLTKILTYAITQTTSGNLASAFTKFFDVSGSTVVVTSLSTYGGGDTAGTTTLLARLTGTRAGLLDNLTNLDASISGVLSAIGLIAPPSAGTIATTVWAAATRTLSAFAFNVTVGTNTDKTGYSLSSSPPSAADIWTYTTRTLTSGGGGSGGASVDELTAAIEPLITAGSFTNADRALLGKALTMEQFVALK